MIYGWPLASDQDLFIHLKLGQLTVEAGRVLRQDIFSYTAAGHPEETHAWLSQVLFWTVFRYFGETGLRVLNFLSSPQSSHFVDGMPGSIAGVLVPPSSACASLSSSITKFRFSGRFSLESFSSARSSFSLSMKQSPYRPERSPRSCCYRSLGESSRQCSGHPSLPWHFTARLFFWRSEMKQMALAFASCCRVCFFRNRAEPAGIWTLLLWLGSRGPRETT